MESGSNKEKFIGFVNHPRSRNGKIERTSSKLFPMSSTEAKRNAREIKHKVVASNQERNILKPTVPKPFRFRTEERSILKSSNAERRPEQRKVKDGELIRKQKEVRKTSPTLTRPFRFRTEERSILRAAKDEHVQQLKDMRLVVKHQEKTQEEKLYPGTAKPRDLMDLSVDHSVLTVSVDHSVLIVSGKLMPVEAVQDTSASLPVEVVDAVGITALPSENSVSEMRGKFECLEIQEELIKMRPYNSVIVKERTEDEANETEEKAEMAIVKKISSKLVDTVDSMLPKLEEEIGDVDTEIDDRRKILDRGYDDKLTPGEVTATAGCLKDNLGKGLQQLIHRSSNDKGDKILVEDIVKLSTQTEGSEIVKEPLKGSFLPNGGAKNESEGSISTGPSFSGYLRIYLFVNNLLGVFRAIGVWLSRLFIKAK